MTSGAITEQVYTHKQAVEIIKETFPAREGTKDPERNIKERIMKRSDFPKPVKQIGKNKIYLRKDIHGWLGLKGQH